MRHRGLNAMQWWKKPDKDTQKLGQEGEAVALHYLLSMGLIHIESNFRRPFGEIDLIMQDHGTLVFVEVRRRSKGRFGEAVDSIDAAKQKRLIKVAQVYLQRYDNSPPCRFDVVTIDETTIKWLKNVIEAAW